MLMGVTCLSCDKEMGTGCVIRGKYPLVQTVWSCPKCSNVVEVTHMSDEEWEKQNKN